MIASIITCIIGSRILQESMVYGEQCSLPQTLNCSQNVEQCVESTLLLSSCNSRKIRTLEVKGEKMNEVFRDTNRSLTLKLAVQTIHSLQLDRRIKQVDKINGILDSKYLHAKALLRKLDVRNNLCLMRQTRTEDVVFKETADFRILQKENSIILKNHLKTFGNRMKKSEEKIAKSLMDMNETLTHVTATVQTAVKQFNMKHREVIGVKNELGRKISKINSSTQRKFRRHEQSIKSLEKAFSGLKMEMMKLQQRLKTSDFSIKTIERRISQKFCQSGRRDIGAVFSRGRHHKPERHVYIRFSKTFITKPTVSYGIVYMDADSTVRIRTTMDNISRSGFRVSLNTWLGSRVHGVMIHWIACS